MGLIAVFTASWGYAVVVVLTRKLKEVHFSLMMFYYGFFATMTLTVALIVEWLFFSDDKVPRILTYSGEQYLYVLIIAVLNAFGMNLSTLAQQYEKSAFVTLIGQIGIFYSYVADVAVFKTEFSIIEIVGALIVLVFNIIAIVNRG